MSVSHESHDCNDETPISSDLTRTQEPIFEWYAAHGSLTQIPEWVKTRVEKKYLDKTKYFGHLYYCKYGAPTRKRKRHHGKDEIDEDEENDYSSTTLQLRCPWKRYCI